MKVALTKLLVTGMQAAFKAYDGREMSTSLVEAFKQHLNLAKHRRFNRSNLSARMGC
jgi:N-acetylglucosamine kinase-like BadF-type ATPase